MPDQGDQKGDSERVDQGPQNEDNRFEEKRERHVVRCTEEGLEIVTDGRGSYGPYA